MLDFSLYPIVDSHFHLSCVNEFENQFNFFREYYGLTCAHSSEEFLEQEKRISCISKIKNCTIYKSFGLHPQNPVLEQAFFLEKLLTEKKLDAVGECGFDFFTESFKENREVQEKAWHIQLELASFYGKPVVIHLRKGLEQIFKEISLLKKVPFLLFHSFYFSEREAFSILKKLPDSVFGFGKSLLNGNKKALSCVEKLPIDNLILETDAPFQTLKNEKETLPSDIMKVYEKFFHIRGINGRREEVFIKLVDNFNNLLSIS